MQSNAVHIAQVGLLRRHLHQRGYVLARDWAVPILLTSHGHSLKRKCSSRPLSLMPMRDYSMFFLAPEIGTPKPCGFDTCAMLGPAGAVVFGAPTLCVACNLPAACMAPVAVFMPPASFRSSSLNAE